MAGHDVVAAQTAQVFGNDHIDLLGLDVADHPLKIRAVKAGTAVPVIHIGVIDLQAVLSHELIQQGLLIGYALGGPLALILL